MSVTLYLKNGERLDYPDAERLDQDPRDRGQGADDCLLITSGDGATYKVYGEIMLSQVATIVTNGVERKVTWDQLGRKEAW